MTTLEAQHEVITNLILENEKLKRERDEAREAAEKWKKLHDTKDELFKKGIAEVERERDEWAERWADLARTCIKDICEMERERDEARGAIKSTIAWLKKRRNAPDFTTMGMVEERLLKALEAAK